MENLINNKLKGFFVVFIILSFCLVCAMPALAQLTDQDIKKIRQEVISKGYSYTVGHNSATNRSMEELCGLAVPADWEEKAQKEGLFEKIVTESGLPSSYCLVEDLVDNLPPIKDQGQCGSCWAFATVGMLEIAIYITDEGRVEDLSEQYLVSCNLDGWGCNGGWWAHDYHWYLPGADEEFGAVPEELEDGGFPYTASNEDCGDSYTHTELISGWSFIATPYKKKPTVDQIKTAMYNPDNPDGVGRPIGVAIVVGEDFQAYTSGVFQGSDRGRLNHTVVLVGWEDDPTLPEGGYWILRNSWGTGWGESGYMRIAYGANRVGLSANFINLP